MLDDRTLALCELSNDLMVQKIPREKIPYYIDNPLQIAREAAQCFGGREIGALYERYGIRIDLNEKSGGMFGVTLRGQATMSKKECAVVVFQESVRELTRPKGYMDIPPLDYETALSMHLAHEFFHFLEYKELGFVSDMLDRVETFRLFSFSRKSAILRASEIAAHAFAKEVTGLPCLPNLYDYIYLIHKGKLGQEQFIEKLTANKHLLETCGQA